MFQPVLRWLVYSNVWVALSASSLIALVEWDRYQGISDKPLLVFFGTLSAYLLIRMLRFEQINVQQKNDFKQWHEKHSKYLLGFLGVSSVLSGWIFMEFPWEERLFLLACSIPTALYALPWMKNKGLRNFPGLKLVLIAGVWALLLAYWPVMNSPGNHRPMISAVFLFAVAITIPFDIRDMHTDAPSMRTLPQIMGAKGARVLALFFALVAIPLLFVYSEQLAFSYLMMCALGVPLLATSSSKRSFWFFAFGIESLPIVWGLCYLLVQFFE